MKIHLQKMLLAMLTAGLVAGCDTSLSSLDEDADAGRADFSIFITVGDSLTAGYADGALYRQIQQNSYPSILAGQFALAGGGAFTQPLMPASGTGSLDIATVDLSRPDRLVLGGPPAAPETIKPTKSTSIDVRLAGAGTFNNLGIPGAKSFHLPAMGYGNLGIGPIAGGTSNPYFARFASSNTTTVLADASGLTPTFFVLWIGANDILLYALDGGGTQNAVPPYGLTSTDVTDPAVFTPSYNGAIAALTAIPSTRGLLVNIPDVASIPYFNTVPHNPIPLSAADAASANGAYAPYNLGLTAALGLITQGEINRRTISFAESDNNALVIIDESLTTVPGLPSIRQATKNDFILLPTSTKIGEEATPGNPATVWGVGMALLDGDVLTQFEHDQVETARKAYNKTIRAAAEADDNLAFMDAAGLLKQLNEEGLNYGSGGVTSEFATGGAFSLDGVHPTARGYAVVANEMMKVIEDAFGAKLPPVDPSDFTTVFYQ